MSILTKAQKQLYDWLVAYTRRQEATPTLREITPSIREMMEAMELRSTSAIQNRLQHLDEKGYIQWLKDSNGRSRRTRIRIPFTQAEAGLPILGTIAAGLLVEPFTDNMERLDLPSFFQQPECFILRVTGSSMIDDHILPGDFVVLQKVQVWQQVRNGTVVAAIVGGKTTLKRFYRDGDSITLQPANPEFEPILLRASQLEIQGVLVGVWRNLG